ncbi:MAG: HAD family phosphatase [Lachnospiraceae bacterium]|nr:HAD family phosphatase [Lachnospiraceae bacterium]
MYKDIKTIIFDMDGVLFDSESLDKKAWIELAEEYGIKNIMSAFKECIGTPDYNIISVLDRYIEKSRQAGCLDGNKPIEGLNGERFRCETLEVFDRFVEEQGMPLKYYAAECLASLKAKGYKLGLASSTPVERVIPQLTDTKLIGYFDDVIGGGMYKKGKPDPEIFLMSCERLGGTPDATIVIEDSYNGIRAAFAAGMKPIMVPDIIMPDDEMRAKAWKIFENLKEVAEFL